MVANEKVFQANSGEGEEGVHNRGRKGGRGHGIQVLEVDGKFLRNSKICNNKVSYAPF